MGDLPVPALRPFAITGTFGYTVADRTLKAVAARVGPGGDGGVTGMPAVQFNSGNSNRWGRRAVAPVQLALLALPGQGLRPARFREQADPAGRGRLVLPGLEAQRRPTEYPEPPQAHVVDRRPCVAPLKQVRSTT